MAKLNGMTRLPKRKRIAFDISSDEYSAISTAARAAGIPPSTLARALFRWAFPVFESEGFDLAALKQRLGEDESLVNSFYPNRRLKHMVADLSLDREALKAVIEKNGWGLPALSHRD